MMENEGLSNECKRLDWKRSRALIERAISNSIEREKCLPTYREIEMETGLSQATIARHVPEILGVSLLLGGMVLENQALRALRTGKSKDVELYFKLNFGWKG
jgi:predicted transcriptional regulator